MKKVKYLILTLVTFLFVFEMNCAMAQEKYDVKYQEGCFYLEAFGISTSNMEYTDSVTRGYVAKAVYTMLYDGVEIMDKHSSFVDIMPDSGLESAAYFLQSTGVMIGYDNCFYPNKNITYNQLAKVFVASLGKNIAAESKGGYPTGYISVALSDGIFDSVGAKGETDVIFGDFAKMFYNFAHCKGFVLSGYNLSEYTNDDTTIMQQALNRKDMYYIEGIVTSNQRGNGTGEEIGKIAIDGVSYKISENVNTNEEFLGYNVNAFIKEDGGLYTIVSLMKSNTKNEEEYVRNFEFEQADLNEIKYIRNNKLQSIKLDEINIVRNGRVLVAYTKEDLIPLNGGIRLVDNDKDGKYEYAHIENKQYFTLKRISYDDHVIALDGSRYEGSEMLYINPEDEDFYHRIYAANGDEISFEDLQEESIVRIEGSSDQKLMKVYVIDQVVQASISVIDNSEDIVLTLNDANYRIAKGVAGQYLIDPSEVKFSTVYDFVIDEDYIVKVNKLKVQATYAYVINAVVEEGIGRDIFYKVVTQDKKVYVGELADTVIYNGKKTNKKNIVPRKNVVIRYRTDENANICYLEELELYSDEGSKMTYNEKTGIFFSQSYSYPLFMSDETTVFVVPNSGEDDDYMADLALIDQNSYRVRAYELNEDDLSVSAIVIYGEDVTYDSPGYVKADSNVCVLNKKYITFDEDRNSVYKLEWVEDEETKSAIVKSTDNMHRIVDKMAVGDVFQYSLTSLGLIDNINVLIRLDQNPAYFHNGANSNVELVYGRVIDAEFKTLPKGNKAEFVNIFTLDVNSDNTKNFIVANDERKVNCYVYDTREDTAKIGTVNQVMTEDGLLGTFSASEIFIYYYQYEAIAIVIKN